MFSEERYCLLIYLFTYLSTRLIFTSSICVRRSHGFRSHSVTYLLSVT